MKTKSPESFWEHPGFSPDRLSDLSVEMVSAELGWMPRMLRFVLRCLDWCAKGFNCVAERRFSIAKANGGRHGDCVWCRDVQGNHGQPFAGGTTAGHGSTYRHGVSACCEKGGQIDLHVVAPYSVVLRLSWVTRYRAIAAQYARLDGYRQVENRKNRHVMTILVLLRHLATVCGLLQCATIYSSTQ